MFKFRPFFYALICTLIIASCDSGSESLQAPEPNLPVGSTTPESEIEFLKRNITYDSIFSINSIVQLPDGSYTLGGGLIYGQNYGVKNVLIKLDKYGNREWLRIMENSSTVKGIEKLFRIGNGYTGYRGHHYMGEKFSHIIHFKNTGEAVEEILLNNDMLGLDIIRDEDNFIIAGYKSNMHYRKITPNGEIIWSRPFQFFPDGLSISKLNDGNYITIGGWNYTGTGDYLMKLNTEGEKIWSKTLSGMKVLAISNNGFLAITGFGAGINFARFDESGNELWSKPISNVFWHINISDVSIFNFDMDYFVCSYLNMEGDLNLLVLDPDGHEKKLLKIEGSRAYDSKFKAVSKTSDNGIFIARTGVTGNKYEMEFIKLSNETIFH